VRTSLEQVGSNASARIDHVFAVVEDQERVCCYQKLRADDRTDEHGVGDARELCEAHAVLKCCLPRCNLQREARLANATRTDQRDQRAARQQLLDVHDGSLTPDKNWSTAAAALP